MSEKTMLDLGGLAFMEGDPLGLRDLEESLMWKANGPLPDWLDDAEPEDDEDEIPAHAEPLCDLPPTAPLELPLPPVLRGERVGVRGDETPRDESSPSPASDEHRAESESIFSNQPPLPPDLPPTVVIVAPHESGPVAPSLTDAAIALATASQERERLEEPASAPLAAELIELPPAPVESEGLVSINDLLRFVDDPPAPPSVQPPAPLPVVAPAPARRVLSFDELIDARLCLLTSVADRLWAIPLDRVAAIAPRDVSGAIDLFERQEAKKRRAAGIAIAFDSDVVVVVDRIHGPRSFGWEQAPTDAPVWMLAQANVAGERVGLLDWEVVVSSPAAAEQPGCSSPATTESSRS